MITTLFMDLGFNAICPLNQTTEETILLTNDLTTNKFAITSTHLTRV